MCFIPTLGQKRLGQKPVRAQNNVSQIRSWLKFIKEHIAYQADRFKIQFSLVIYPVNYSACLISCARFIEIMFLLSALLAPLCTDENWNNVDRGVLNHVFCQHFSEILE